MLTTYFYTVLRSTTDLGEIMLSLGGDYANFGSFNNGSTTSASYTYY